MSYLQVIYWGGGILFLILKDISPFFQTKTIYIYVQNIK
jgi:hypothetical protein